VIEEMLEKVSDRDIRIQLSKSAKQYIAEKGFDPQFGARPLKRTIQRFIENPIAEEILRGNFIDGSLIRVGKHGDRLTFSEAHDKAIKHIDSKDDNKN
ncbi:MAG: hypothetical protein SCK70_07415, partial [bacterium]|nr:hypothetical protein [bacterium]